MEKHILFLNKSIEIIESDDINKDNLEYRWYGPWNAVLNYWFGSKFILIPQYEILYELVDRDNNMVYKSIKPDFTIVEYIYEDDVFYKRIGMIVEIKRSSNDIEKDFKTASKQLGCQVSALFSNGEYKYVYGITAIGKYWRLYKYNFIRTNIHKKTWDNAGYNDATNNYRRVYESRTLDISSKNYYNDFNELTRLIN